MKLSKSNSTTFKLLSLFSLILFLLPLHGQRAFITDQAAGEVIIFDITTEKKVGSIPLGGNPIFLAATPDKSKVVVISSTSNTVSIIDPNTNSVINTVNTGGVGARDLILSPDGKFAYVVNETSDNISVIDLVNGSLAAIITVGDNPEEIIISPDGKKVFVTNRDSKSVSIIDATTNIVIATPSVANTPSYLDITPDGSKVLVTLVSGSSSTIIIDAVTNLVTTNLVTPSNPEFIGISRDGKIAVTSNSSTLSASIINLTTNTVVATVPGIGITFGSWNVIISPDNKKAYVLSFRDKIISVIDLTTNTFVSNINLSISPFTFGFFLSPDQSKIYVTGHGGTLSIVDLTTNQEIGAPKIGSSLVSMVFLPSLPSPPIPTLSQWGLLIFGLVLVNLGVLSIYRLERESQQ